MTKPGLFTRHDWLRDWGLIILATVVIIFGGAWGLRTWYSHNLQPVSTSQEVTYFTIESGDSVSLVAEKLKEANLIRSTRAFETYVRSNNLFSDLQAGTYALTPSLSTQQIVKKMTGGDVAKNLLTILPGKRLDQIRDAFIEQGYSAAEVDAALNPANYSGHPALASLPAGASLEGYLYPESYQRLDSTPASAIIRQSLDQMQKYLTPEVIEGFKAQGLNVYQGITLASIVLREYSNPVDEKEIMPKIAQVFTLRLKQGIALEADPTAIYGAVKDKVSLPEGKGRAAAAIAYNSPYNTYKNPGLPPGPISNTNNNALKAVASPAPGNNLYFVAGDDCIVRFNATLEAHQSDTEKYLVNGCRP